MVYINFLRLLPMCSRTIFCWEHSQSEVTHRSSRNLPLSGQTQTLETASWWTGEQVQRSHTKTQPARLCWNFYREQSIQKVHFRRTEEASVHRSGADLWPWDFSLWRAHFGTRLSQRPDHHQIAGWTGKKREKADHCDHPPAQHSDFSEHGQTVSVEGGRVPLQRTC